MSLQIHLQPVSGDEIEMLQADPECIHTIESSFFYSTYYYASLNYFLTGEAYPYENKEPLSYILRGQERYPCASLAESPYIEITRPENVIAIENALRKVDAAVLRDKIETADFDTIINAEELYDLEFGSKEGSIESIMSDLKRLQGFYAEVLNAKTGVVMHIS